MSEEVAVKKSKSISPVWIIPLLALVLAGWLLYYQKQQLGPEISIQFKSADGLEEGKTQLKLKNVTVGVVSRITLSEDLQSVIVDAKLDRSVEQYINENTKYWVEKPRVGTEGVTGLGTLLSGAYIAIEAGAKGESQREFEGLEKPPLTADGISGRTFFIYADERKGLSVGAPVYFHSIKVGKIADISLAKDNTRIEIDVFIQTPYDKLVSLKTNFWRIKGVQFELSAGGFQFELESLETLLQGGIGFDLQSGQNFDNQTPFALNDPSTRFPLYDDKSDVGKRSFARKEYFVLKFDQSVRGLRVGSLVEFRGIQLGKVTKIDTELDTQSQQIVIPITIEIEPERLGLGGHGDQVSDDAKVDYQQLINRGLRARLDSANLLTGQLLVALDFYTDVESEPLVYYGELPELPTVKAGFDELRASISTVLKKVNDLDVESLIKEMNTTLQSLQATSSGADEKLAQITANLNNTINKAEQFMNNLDTGSEFQYELSQTMKALKDAAKSIDELAQSIDKDPNSILFGKDNETQ